MEIRRRSTYVVFQSYFIKASDKLSIYLKGDVSLLETNLDESHL